MAKPATLQGYTSEYTLDCERVLVTLLRGLATRVASPNCRAQKHYPRSRLSRSFMTKRVRIA